MSKIIVDVAMSLDGFMAGDNRGPQNPLGDGGIAIHEWMFKQKGFYRSHGMEAPNEGLEDGADGKLIEDIMARTGAYIMGKRMFEEGEANWPEDLFKKDVYVLTNEVREPWVQNGSTVFYFINDGIESALEKASKSANGKNIRIQGGGDTIQQFLNAGLIDEFTLHISPVFLGSGIRLFDKIDKEKYKFEIVDVTPSQLTTHIQYRVIK